MVLRFIQEEVMTIIDGVNVAIWKCDNCGSNELWFFKGDNGGFKLVCSKCQTEDRDLIDFLKIPYLWASKEEICEN